MRALREGRPPCVRLPGRSVLVLLLLGSEGVIAGLCEARVSLFCQVFRLFLANCCRYSLVYRWLEEIGNGRGGERNDRMNGRLLFFLLGVFATLGAARSIPIRDEIFFVLQCSDPMDVMVRLLILSSFFFLTRGLP